MTTAGVCTFPTVLGVIATGLMKMQMSRQEINNLWSSHNMPGSQGCSLMTRSTPSVLSHTHCTKFPHAIHAAMQWIRARSWPKKHTKQNTHKTAVLLNIFINAVLYPATQDMLCFKAVLCSQTETRQEIGTSVFHEAITSNCCSRLHQAKKTSLLM